MHALLVVVPVLQPYFLLIPIEDTCKNSEKD